MALTQQGFKLPTATQKNHHLPGTYGSQVGTNETIVGSGSRK